MIRTLRVGAGGFLGGVARYGLGGLIHRCTTTRFPAGRLAVNTIGSLVIGVLMSLVEDRQLLGRGAAGLAIWSIPGNVLLGLAAVLLGWGATRALLT